MRQFKMVMGAKILERGVEGRRQFVAVMVCGNEIGWKGHGLQSFRGESKV
jgi:hypothetical protein